MLTDGYWSCFDVSNRNSFCSTYFIIILTWIGSIILQKFNYGHMEKRRKNRARILLNRMFLGGQNWSWHVHDDVFSLLYYVLTSWVPFIIRLKESGEDFGSNLFDVEVFVVNQLTYFMDQYFVLSTNFQLTTVLAHFKLCCSCFDMFQERDKKMQYLMSWVWLQREIRT